MSAKSIAEVLAGSPAAFDSQGLQAPAIDPVMILSGLAGPAMAKALAGVAESTPGMLASQSGAIFPEGGLLPKDKGLLQELGSILPESQKNYLRNQALSDWHAQNQDWPRVLADKWAMLTHTGGSR